MAWTYLLRCADGTYYAGSTIDLNRRIWEHNEGLGAAYTRRPGRRPVQLAWCYEYRSIQAAFDFEKQLQGWSRAKREALIRGDYEALPNLAKKVFDRGSGPPPGVA